MADDSDEPRGRPLDALELFVDAKRAPRSVGKFFRLLARAVRLVWSASHAGLILSFVLGSAQALLGAAQVVLAAKALNLVIGHTTSHLPLRDAVPTMLLLGGVMLLSTAMGALVTQQSRLLGEQAQQKALADTIRVASSVELEQFDDPSFFDRMQRVVANSSVRPVAVTGALTSLLAGIIGSIAVGATVVAINPWLLPTLVVVGAPSLVLARMLGRREFGFIVAQTPRIRERDYYSRLLVSRENAKEVRAFHLGPEAMGRWDSRFMGYLSDLKRHVIRQGTLALLSALASVLATGATLGLLLWFVASHQISLGDAGGAVVAVQLLAGRLSSLMGSISTLFEAGLFLEEMSDFLDQPLPDTDWAPALSPFKRFTLDDVAYRYPGSTKLAVEGISIEIGAGEVIALVGENGSGKTTLAKVIAGLLPPTEGQISWDGQPLAVTDMAALRRSVGVLFQDFGKYELTALDNVWFGDVHAPADLDRVRAAAARSGADKYLNELPTGYSTPLSRVYAAGRDLSIGQWQRVALARAYYRDAPFLILDEPTASLDPRAEAALFDQIRNAMRGRTVLLITHRLSSVREADRIYVLKDGHVAEHGTHRELAAADGLYAELYEMQAKAFVD